MTLHSSLLVRSSYLCSEWAHHFMMIPLLDHVGAGAYSEIEGELTWRPRILSLNAWECGRVLRVEFHDKWLFHLLFIFSSSFSFLLSFFFLSFFFFIIFPLLPLPVSFPSSLFFLFPFPLLPPSSPSSRFFFFFFLSLFLCFSSFLHHPLHSFIFFFFLSLLSTLSSALFLLLSIFFSFFYPFHLYLLLIGRAVIKKQFSWKQHKESSCITDRLSLNDKCA